MPARDEELLQSERDIRAKLAGHDFDFESMQAIANIYRAAAAVRRHAERDVLAESGLSWGGFTILWVLWVWGPMETGQLAIECDLAKGTLTGMLSTLEKQQLVTRTRVASDRRRMLVDLTDAGTHTIADLFPRFNRFEAAMADGLSVADKRRLAAALRHVTRNAG